MVLVSADVHQQGPGGAAEPERAGAKEAVGNVELRPPLATVENDGVRCLGVGTSREEGNGSQEEGPC
jgi:hypothetical protein